MLGEAYPFLTEQGARILVRVGQGPVSVIMLFDEEVAFAKGAVQSAMQRFVLQGLIELHDLVDATPRDHGHRIRKGPPQLLYVLTPKGHAALAAHRAGVRAFRTTLKKYEAAAAAAAAPQDVVEPPP